MASFLQELKHEVKNWWLFTVIGILLLIAGFYTISNPSAGYLGLAFNPVIGVATIVGWTAFAFIIAGMVNIVFSLQLKKIRDIFIHKI